MPSCVLLGVNIDHIATLRQVRGTKYPDPVYAAQIAEQAGADGITLHLREDRRHIQARDVQLLTQVLQTRMNLEMAVTDEMALFAEQILPLHICLVPERREELTTEGGLDVVKNYDRIKNIMTRLTKINSEVSLFIDPCFEQIDAAIALRAPVIEIHTGAFADAEGEAQRTELKKIQSAVSYAASNGLVVNAGHGLHYHNVQAIARIVAINELNIGHAIIARAVFVGLFEAVKEMKHLIVCA